MWCIEALDITMVTADIAIKELAWAFSIVGKSLKAIGRYNDAGHVHVNLEREQKLILRRH